MIECDLTYSVNKIGGRWKILILSKLEQKKTRFSELKKEIPLITERMLTLQLRALEEDGLVRRTVYAEVPPRVEYELTELSEAFGPIFKQLSDWGSATQRFPADVKVTGDIGERYFLNNPWPPFKKIPISSHRTL